MYKELEIEKLMENVYSLHSTYSFIAHKQTWRTGAVVHITDQQHRESVTTQTQLPSTKLQKLEIVFTILEENDGW